MTAGAVAALCTAKFGGVWVGWVSEYCGPQAFQVVLERDRYGGLKLVDYNPSGRVVFVEQEQALAQVRNAFVSEDGELVDSSTKPGNIPNFLGLTSPFLNCKAIK